MFSENPGGITSLPTTEENSHLFSAVIVFSQLIQVIACVMTYTTSSRGSTLALELRERSQEGSMWVRSPKIGSSLECSVLPSFSFSAPSHKHLLAFYNFKSCRIHLQSCLKLCFKTVSLINY